MWDGGRMTENDNKGKYAKPSKKFSYEESATESFPVEEVVAEAAALDDLTPVIAPEPIPEPVVIKTPVAADSMIADAQNDAAIVAELIAESRAVVEARKAVKVEPSNDDIINELIEESRAVIKARKDVKEGVSDEKIIAAGVARKAALQKKLDSLYTVGAWEDLKNYECKVCPYSTLDVEMVRSHVRKHI
jgi:hypothetical protein